MEDMSHACTGERKQEQKFTGIYKKEKESMEKQILYTPARLGKLELENRWIMLAMHTGYADEDGSFSRRDLEFYRARAGGGAAAEGPKAPGRIDIQRGKIPSRRGNRANVQCLGRRPKAELRVKIQDTVVGVKIDAAAGIPPVCQDGF